MRDKARCADLDGGTPTEFELLPGFLGFARPKSGHFFSKVHQIVAASRAEIRLKAPGNHLLLRSCGIFPTNAN